MRRITHRTPQLLTILLLALMLAACGGGGDSISGPQRDLESIVDLEAERESRRLEEEQEQSRIEAAEAERLRLEAEAAEAERLELEAQATEANESTSGPETEAESDTEREEVPNPYNIPSEWVWHDGRFIPLEDVPVEEKHPAAPASSVYLSWDYHSRPNLHDFGSWADESPLHRDLGHAEFGVGMRDGEYVPWMRGGLSETSLYANDEVRRTYDEYGYWTAEYNDFRWNGLLVGFTPDGESVAGNATLSDFDFGGYSHRGIGPERRHGWDPGKAYLHFTELAYDDGTTWGDGDLEYEVGIGKTFGGGATAHDNSFSHPFRRELYRIVTSGKTAPVLAGRSASTLPAP